jgi:hypothetical protein
VSDIDGDGFISLDEMIAYFTSVFKVMKETIHDGETLLGQGVTPEQLARATAIDCFKQADVNGDGRVSLDEFRVWYSLPAVAAVAPSAPPPSLAPVPTAPLATAPVPSAPPMSPATGT